MTNKEIAQVEPADGTVLTADQEQALSRFKGIQTLLTGAAQMYAVAVEREDWKTLKYPTIEDWREDVLGPVRFKAEARKEIEDYLRENTDLSYRRIARALGVSIGTIAGDQADERSENEQLDQADEHQADSDQEQPNETESESTADDGQADTEPGTDPGNVTPIRSDQPEHIFRPEDIAADLTDYLQTSGKGVKANRNTTKITAVLSNRQRFVITVEERSPAPKE